MSRVLMIQPPTDEHQVRILDTFHIETIIIYTRERAPSNASLFYFDHIPSLLDRSNALYEQNRQRVMRIQELCLMRRQLQQQQTEQTQDDQTQQQQNDIGAAAALNDEVIIISDDDDDDHCC